MTVEKTGRRRPWVAFLLSLVQPGLGQLYGGRVLVAGCFYALQIALWIAQWKALPDPSPTWFSIGCAVLVGGTVVLSLTAAIEAGIGTSRIENFRSAWFARWYGCLGAFVVIGAVGFLIQPEVGRYARAFHVPSTSMRPTIEIGDYILAQVDPALGTDIRPCELVLFRNSSAFIANNEDVIYIKRVVALPGDTVGYVQGRLRLNGVVVPRLAAALEAEGAAIYRETLPSGCSYLIRDAYENGPLDDVPDIRVPAGTFYVLGDNRDDSIDSRSANMGPIPLADYRGRAAIIYWAWNLRRIGTLLN